jgi:hypothetical protein
MLIINGQHLTEVDRILELARSNLEKLEIYIIGAQYQTFA